MRPAANPEGRNRITTLGSLRIERDGEEIRDLPAQPIRCALFLYLAIEGGATRDELAALFWPERSSGRARRSLSQMLYELRGQLGDDWFETRGERVEVTPAVVVDALEFMAAAEAWNDDVALSEYGGAFLDGCHLGATPGFEQWVDRRRSQLARLHRDVCRRLTAARVAAGDTDGALEVARRWAEMDPLEDEAHHRIIELLAEVGRRSEALRHFEAYRLLIARELEVEPLEETQALVARIREGAVPAPGAQGRAEPDPTHQDVAGTPPLAGPVAGTGEDPPSLAASRQDPAARSAAETAAAAPARGGPVAPAPKHRRVRRLLTASPGRHWILGSVAVLVTAGTVLVWGGAGADPPARTPATAADDGAALDPSGIAVLPFLNLSADPEQEYFSDGITEDVLTALSKIADLTVISRTSVMQYKGTTKTVRRIGEELGVAHILEGSVRRVDDRVRVVAQLIDARTDQHLWAESYDRELTDIFAIQSEIAQRIAGALQARLTPAEQERLAARPTTSLTAYDFYLQGRQYYYRGRPEDYLRAIELFRRAIEMDSSFALAWAGLADAYALTPQWFGAPHAREDSALAAARRAIALDPGLAEGYNALGVAYQVRGWYGRAEEAYAQALALNPNYASAIGRTGGLRYATGRWDEALELFHRSLALNPASRIAALANATLAYGALGLFDRALETNELLMAIDPGNRPGLMGRVLLAAFMEDDPGVAIARAEELLAAEPDHPAARTAAATAWLFSGDYAEARRHLERAYEAAPEMTRWGRYVAVQLGFTLWKTGEQERARRVFADFERFALDEIAAGNEDRELRYSLAVLHAVQGDTEQAYRWLDEMVAFGWTDHLLISRDPLLENLHGDERFQGIVARNRAEIERQRARVEREGW